MGRKQSDTVDYFPHFGKDRIGEILENRYGNDGYAVRYKVRELLCISEGHYYDCSDEINYEYFLAKMGAIDEKTLVKILNMMAKLGEIDRELWGEKILWCKDLVNDLRIVYDKRGRDLPKKPNLCTRNDMSSGISGTEKGGERDSCTRNNMSSGISGTEMRQSKVEESKVEESRVEQTTEKTDCGFEKLEIRRNYLKLEFVKLFKRLPYAVSRNEKQMYERRKKFDKKIEQLLRMTGGNVDIFVADMKRVGEKKISDMSYFLFRKDSKETRWEQVAEQFRCQEHEKFKEEWKQATEDDKRFDIFGKAIGQNDYPDWVKIEAKKYESLLKKFRVAEGNLKEDLRREIMVMKRRYGL